MNNHPPTKTEPVVPPGNVPAGLENLLEIISKTSASMENIWNGNNHSEKYFSMLRADVDQAARVTAQLIEHAGVANEKVLFHPAFEAALKGGRPATAPVPQKKRSLMVVDDDSGALDLAKRILGEANFDVITAQSGFSCLDLFTRQPDHFDLILLDLTMPFMDGEETFNRLQGIRPDVAVLLSTGFIPEEQLDRMLAAGLAGFLHKPHRPDELVTQIESILDKLKVAGRGSATPARGSF